MSYDYEDAETDERFGERLEQAIERIARDASSLAETLDENVKRLAMRHDLVRQMAAAEKLANLTTKALEKRVLLIRQICAIDRLADEDLSRLQQRLACLETIRRLEPGEQTPIKKLRERARLLERANADMPRLALVHDRNGEAA
jgi:predicted RNase H-like nuclease (RuvC/YqgF family)